MVNSKWRYAVMGVLVVAMVGCASLPAKPDAPDFRVFAGLIVSLRPTVSTMVVSKDEGRGKDAYPNFIYVKYDAATKFLLDDQPATLTDIEQYMKVKIAGHMRDGRLFAETVNFSSVPPPNVKLTGQVKE